MAVKHVFIPFDAFRSQVVSTEIGVVSRLANEYLKGIANEYHPCGQRYRDLMYLPYPFQVSYSAHVLDSCEIRNAIEAKYEAWIAQNRATMTENTPLPVYCDNEHNFGEMKRSRLDTIMANTITVEEYREQGDARILINADRDNYLYLDVNHDMELPSMVIYRTNSPKSFVRMARDRVMQSESIHFQTPWSADPTARATNGKIMAGGPWTHHGPACTEWVIHLDDAMIDMFRDRTGVLLPPDTTLVDFGDYEAHHVTRCQECHNFDNCEHKGCDGYVDPEASYSERIAALAHPIERLTGTLKGESIHKGTTNYVTMWVEY